MRGTVLRQKVLTRRSLARSRAGQQPSDSFENEFEQYRLLMKIKKPNLMLMFNSGKRSLDPTSCVIPQGGSVGVQQAPAEVVEERGQGVRRG